MSMAWRLGSKIQTARRAKHISVALFTGHAMHGCMDKLGSFFLTVGHGDPILGNWAIGHRPLCRFTATGWRTMVMAATTGIGADIRSC